MARKIYGKKYVPRKGVRKGGRRMGVTAPGAVPGIISTAGKLVKAGYGAYKTYQRGKYVKRQARRSDTLATSDNITTMPITTIGKSRKLGFAEKVARVERPPILFKRNYQFSAEGFSGRKAWFTMNFNHHSNDLNQDITTYKENLTSDTVAADDTFTATSIADRARFYVDYMSSKIQLMNSSTNALTGKMHLFAFKRDAKAQYNSVPVNAVNLMAYYSTNAVPLYVSGQESTVGNGWKFSPTGNPNSTGYLNNCNMPGSTINLTGVCLSTDLALSPLSPHIKSDVGFWFRHVSTQGFSLKPGQQINKMFKFHDLPVIAREQLDFEFLDGVSYQVAVEFQGQVIGSDDIAAGINVISTGSSQLSVVREDIRVLGQKNGLKSKVMLITTPLSAISAANQYIINPDTGVPLDAYVEDQ